MTTSQPRSQAPLALGAITFRDRQFDSIMRSAQLSGFAAIGLTVGQCISAVERGIPLEEISEKLADHNLRLAEFELIRMAEDGAVSLLNSMVCELNATLRPDRIHIAAFTGSHDRITKEFAEFCRRLYPTDVAIEFMPYSNVPNLSAARDLVEAAHTPNAKIVLDVLHFFRSGGQLNDLTPDSLADVACVQLSDVCARPNVGLANEARHLRTYPGRGSLDIVGFLSVIGDQVGTLPPVSVEPISDALESIDLGVVAEETMLTTAKVIEAAGFTYSEESFTKHS